uniref:Actin-related protein 5 n=1 Tax=Globodera pallida TaxID=36090 RepID=A0A183BNJ4_GLOPA
MSCVIPGLSTIAPSKKISPSPTPTQSRAIVRLLIGHISRPLSHPNEKGHTHEWMVAFADNTEEIVFENFRFNSFLRTSAPSCTAQAHCSSENPCCIVVDSGHSFTHIVPFVEGKIVREGIIRTDVGGKALTNQLKDWISYRQLHVMDETYLINCCKEDCCFVSTNFQHDMEHWRVALFRIERLQQELEDVQQADDDQLLLRCCLALMERMPEQLELDSEECTVAFDIDTFDEEAVYALEQLLLLNPAASS